MLIGYARVSTRDQNLEVQIDQLRAAGCEKIFEEKKSGTTREGRTELDACLKFAREGDLVIVAKLDRFARSMGDFCDLVRIMNEKKIGFKCLSPDIDTSGIYGELVTTILMAVAQFEWGIRKERQMEGIAKAKAKGLYRKGQRMRTDGKRRRIAELKKANPDWNAARIGRELNIPTRSVYRLTLGMGLWAEMPERLREGHERKREILAAENKVTF